MIDNIRHKSIRKKTASRIAAIQILYLHQFNDETLSESISTYDKHYKNFLLEKLEIKELDNNIIAENNKFSDYSIEKDFSNNTNSLEEYPEDDNIYTFSGGGDENISISPLPLI